MKQHVLSGLDRLETADAWLKNQRVGLMTNPTGMDHSFQSAVDLLHRRYHLTALFAVEHGIRGDAQAGADIADSVDPATGVRVYSAYGANDHFTDEMLDAFDVLVFDIQDVGARFYTYLYSLAYAMQACDRAGKRMVVLDRINPLGGVKRFGTILQPAFASFVGDYALPTQYGLTIGEYALYVRSYLHLKVALKVVTLQGWSRALRLDQTDLPWVAPSPNCADLDTALCYPGTCIFEGTNISEGRGTTQPFRLIGAPFLDGSALAKELNALGLPGLYFRPTCFRPTFSKHANELCFGVQLHITDRDAADPFAGGLYLLDAIRHQAGEKLTYLQWHEGGRYSLDKLLGTDAYRTGRQSVRDIIEEGQAGIRAFSASVRGLELYA